MSTLPEGRKPLTKMPSVTGSINQNFKIDETNSDEDCLYVDVPGRASIAIQITDEGIIVDLYDAQIQNSSVATCGATWDEINDPGELT